MTAERPARPHRPPDLTAVGDTMADAFRLLRAPPEAPDGPRTPARRVRTGSETAGDLRQLIERQALCRVDAGDLTDAQEEELGATLLALHERMTELCAASSIPDKTKAPPGGGALTWAASCAAPSVTVWRG
ncbi:gas vesicle protein K [Streptomyces sp. C]|uniref:gas vesicle protein K n=1 Tax=Streptomyces sp. C TaxID=253839 RepID=UPI0001B55C43|nr:gas vesicle protein K [Streptomyces sp. C]EFL13177.1 predicted protein [Streptomyces sp. C]